MANIAVSIDAEGNITCPDETLAAGSQVTWVVTGGTVTSIAPGKPSPFNTPPAISRGQWNATVIASGSYTITDSVGKTRTPRITILTPKPVKSS